MQTATQELLSYPQCDYFSKSKILDPAPERKTLPDGAIITILGIAFHCLADGFAFGSSGYRNNKSFINYGSEKLFVRHLDIYCPDAT